jgi:hypothetical protein
MSKSRHIALAALVTLTAGAVYAANTQVSPSAFKAAGRTGYVYGRSDGVFQEENSKAPYIIENGTAAKEAGFGYYESFTPGEYSTDPSVFLTVAGVVAAANAQELNIGYYGPHAFIFGQSTAQTLRPAMTSIGLNIAADLVSAEAYEMFAGILGASGRPAVIGKDPAFYFCATAEINDASGASDWHVGWRSAEVTQVKAITSYLNYATIGIEGTSNPNTIQIMTGNDGTDVTTDTTDTWADAASKKLCVNVSAAGVVTYTINDAAPTTTAAFTFDDGDAVIPFIASEHSGDAATDTFDITLWEVGYQE